jgi:hypothetical protein
VPVIAMTGWAKVAMEKGGLQGAFKGSRSSNFGFRMTAWHGFDNRLALAKYCQQNYY